MRAVGQAVAPELIHAALYGQTARHAVAQINVAGAAAQRRAALPRRQTVLEAFVGQQLAQHAIRAVELPHFPERPVGHEIDRILTVADRQLHREAPLVVGGVIGDEIAAAIRFERPSRLEPSDVVRGAEQGRPHERRVGEQHATLPTHSRAGGEPVADADLLQPVVVLPHAGPRSVDPRRAVARGPDALHAQLERSAERVGTDGGAVRPAAERRIARRQERVIQDQPVPAAPLQAEHPLRREAAPAPQERIARRLAPQPPADGKDARVRERDGQVFPAHQHRCLEQVGEPLGANVELVVGEEAEGGFDVDAPVAVADGVVVRVHQEALAAGIDGRLELPLEGQAEAHFDHLQEHRHRHERLGADAIGLHRARADPADLQLDDHRLRVAGRVAGAEVSAGVDLTADGDPLWSGVEHALGFSRGGSQRGAATHGAGTPRLRAERTRAPGGRARRMARGATAGQQQQRQERDRRAPAAAHDVSRSGSR